MVYHHQTYITGHFAKAPRITPQEKAPVKAGVTKPKSIVDKILMLHFLYPSLLYHSISGIALKKADLNLGIGYTLYKLGIAYRYFLRIFNGYPTCDLSYLPACLSPIQVTDASVWKRMNLWGNVWHINGCTVDAGAIYNVSLLNTGKQTL